MWESEFREALKESLEEIKAVNPSFSNRAYAKRLGISSGALSEILAGKRSLSPARALAILDIAKLEEVKAIRIKNLIERNYGKERKLLVSGEQLEKFLGCWVYSAVLHFFDLEEVDLTPESIATRLMISLEDTQAAINHLLKMKILEIDEKGQIIKNNHHFTTEDNIPSVVIRNSHREGLELASKSLDNAPMDQRDITTMVFAGNPTHMELARKMIRNFHESLEMTMAKSPKSEVYRLQVQLFPLTGSAHEA